MKAYALCWPNDPRPLLYWSAETAEQERQWFTKNYAIDRDGRERGRPFVVELTDLPPTPKPRKCADGNDEFGKAAALHQFEHYIGTPFESTLRAVFDAGVNRSKWADS